MKTRTFRINQVRALLREFGVHLRGGATHVTRSVREVLEELPAVMHEDLLRSCEEIEQLRDNVQQADRQLKALSATEPAIEWLMSVPGIGPITSTALLAAVGTPHRFKTAKHFASYLGVTPREESSGQRRWLGPITKRGNRYVRTQVIHGARSVLSHAKRRGARNSLEEWALRLEQKKGFNKSAVALANRILRAAWAVWSQERLWTPERPTAALAH